LLWNQEQSLKCRPAPEYRLAVRHADTTGNKSTLFNIKPTRTLVGLFVLWKARHIAFMLGIPHASGKEVLSLPGGFLRKAAQMAADGR
jgi:hypothetical protein